MTGGIGVPDEYVCPTCQVVIYPDEIGCGECGWRPESETGTGITVEAARCVCGAPRTVFPDGSSRTCHIDLPDVGQISTPPRVETC